MKSFTRALKNPWLILVVLQAFLNGELQIPADEAFVNAVQSYFEEFLKSDRVVALVSSGGSSANDFREVCCVLSIVSCSSQS